MNDLDSDGMTGDLHEMSIDYSQNVGSSKIWFEDKEHLEAYVDKRVAYAYQRAIDEYCDVRYGSFKDDDVVKRLRYIKEKK